MDTVFNGLAGVTLPSGGSFYRLNISSGNVEKISHADYLQDINQANGGNNLPNKGNNYMTNLASHISKPIDFSNISVDEFNTLIKSGHKELLNNLPFILSNVLEPAEYSSEEVGQNRIDFMSLVESSIEFKKSIGEDVSMLEQLQKKMKELNGQAFPKKLDVIA